MAQDLREHLAAGKPASSFPDHDQNAFRDLAHEMRFLTAKPIIYLANVDEDSLVKENVYLLETRETAAKYGVEVIAMCGALEMEMAEMSEEERVEFLMSYYVTQG